MFAFTRAVILLIPLALFSCGKLDEKPKPPPFADTISAIGLRLVRSSELELQLTADGTTRAMHGLLDSTTHVAKMSGTAHHAEVKCADARCEQAEIVIDGTTRVLHRLHKGLKFRAVGTPGGEGLQARAATALQGITAFDASLYISEIGQRRLFSGHAKFGRKQLGFAGAVGDGSRVRLLFDDGLRSEEKTYGADVIWYAEDLRLSVAFTEGAGLPVISMKP